MLSKVFKSFFAQFNIELTRGIKVTFGGLLYFSRKSAIISELIIGKNPRKEQSIALLKLFRYPAIRIDLQGIRLQRSVKVKVALFCKNDLFRK